MTDFTQRKLEKVAGEQDLMLSLCLENEDHYLESGTEILITASGYCFMLLLQPVGMLNALPEGDFQLTYCFHGQVLCSVLVSARTPVLCT